MTDWQIIQQQAKKFLLTKTEWTSFIQGRRYQIISVEESKIWIEKVSGGYPVRLSKSLCTSAINRIKKQKILKKSQLLSSSVARETSLVYLHPFLNWNPKDKEIFWEENTSLDITTKFIEEASNDDLDKMLVAITKRKNQSLFRKNLLSVYSEKCSVTDTDIKSVLQAGHIISHSISGNNESINGILLRSDLHILFDEGKLLIHPKKLTLHLHPDIVNSYYAIYEGKKIRNRIDNKKPSELFLKQKWNNADWTKSIV